MPTVIDREAYEKWHALMPPRLQNFMSNFFGTCEPFDIRSNYMNYMSDIDSYANGGAKVYRQYRVRLRKAFLEITGQVRYKRRP